MQPDMATVAMIVVSSVFDFILFSCSAVRGAGWLDDGIELVGIVLVFRHNKYSI